METDISKENSGNNSKEWINPEKAIKNMKWIVILGVLIAGAVAFVVQIEVSEENDLRNASSLAVEIIFGIYIALVVYVYSKKMDKENKRIQTESQIRIEQAVEQTSKEIIKKVVDIANAQIRAGENGKVALREGEIGADLVKNINEDSIGVGDSLDAKVTRAKDVKPVAEKTVKHSTDTFIVTRQKKSVTFDAVLTESPQKQVEDIKKEIDQLKIQLQNRKTKRKKTSKVSKKKKQSKSRT